MRLLPDSRLTDKITILTRIHCIEKEIEAMENVSTDYLNKCNFEKRHNKFKKLIQRKETLQNRLKEVRFFDCMIKPNLTK